MPLTYDVPVGVSIPRTRSRVYYADAGDAHLEAENHLPDYKPNDEDMEDQDKDEEELEKEEDVSEVDEPGKYEPISVVGKKANTKSKKGRGRPKATR
jgi:hypothetical protein